MKITIEQEVYGTKVSAEIPDDATTEAVADALRGLLVSLTYHVDSVLSILPYTE